VYIHTSMCVCVCVWARARACLRACVYVCVYIYIYIHTHACVLCVVSNAACMQKSSRLLAAVTFNADVIALPMNTSALHLQ
jgi:hypothetical protein